MEHSIQKILTITPLHKEQKLYSFIHSLTHTHSIIKLKLNSEPTKFEFMLKQIQFNTITNVYNKKTTKEKL